MPSKNFQSASKDKSAVFLKRLSKNKREYYIYFYEREEFNLFKISQKFYKQDIVF